MEYKDYYKILGVPKTANEKDIKAAYRRLARKWHPDVNPQNHKQSEAKFKEINEANDVLSDPAKRKKYDELGANWNQYEQWQRGGGQQQQGPFQWGGFGQQGGGGGQYQTMTQEELEQILGGMGGNAAAAAHSRTSSTCSLAAARRQANRRHAVRGAGRITSSRSR